MIKKYLSPSKYARDLLVAHDNDYATIKEILLKDRAALGVVSALVLVANLASLTTTSRTIYFNELFLVLHLSLHLISAMSALACIWIGVQQYLKINLLPPKAAYRYKLLMAWYEEPISFQTSALATLPPAMVCEIFLTHGPIIGMISFWIVSTIYSFILVLVVVSATKYHTALKEGEQASPDQPRSSNKD